MFPAMHSSSLSRCFPCQDYDLDATLASGQTFRWRRLDRVWTGVVRGRWVRLRRTAEGIEATLASPTSDWEWLAEFLQCEARLDRILATFPRDEPMLAARRACRGLRLLRQEPWECLASFILSSTKQIVQIEQVVEALCRRFGRPVDAPPGEPCFAFPTAERLARCPEADLRACKMGFRAPYLLGTARAVADGLLDLGALGDQSIEAAREWLMALPGVGRKIADCVLLFTGLFPQAFPVDVWILRTLRTQYFEGRAVPLREVVEFTGRYFGPFAGYAQQYLFHAARTGNGVSGASKRAENARKVLSLPLPGWSPPCIVQRAWPPTTRLWRGRRGPKPLSMA